MLDAEFFRDLINPDPIRSLLGWLDDPSSFRQRLDTVQWSAFLQQSVADYGFNPAADGEITAAGKLGNREGSWGQVWRRFAETPERYPGIPARLRQAKPMRFSFEPSEAWPQDNEDSEDRLRNDLQDFAVLTAEGARKEATRLDDEHAWRRGTVWADLDQSPLAFAVEQLALLAELTTQPLSSTDLASLTADYADRGWPRTMPCSEHSLRLDPRLTALLCQLQLRPCTDPGSKRGPWHFKVRSGPWPTPTPISQGRLPRRELAQ